MGMRRRCAPAGSDRFLVDHDHAVVLNAGPGEVWDALEDLSQAVGWSRWVERIEVDGDRLREGAVVHVSIATPLPFSVKARLLLDTCVREQMIVATVEGDLAGEARLALTPEGPATLVELSWSLEMRHPVMRALALVSGPLLRWGHDLVADATVRSFSGWLARHGAGRPR
jgi:hypothetical protein